MCITDLIIRFINWQNSGTDKSFCKRMSISRAKRTITLLEFNGNGEKIFSKTITLSQKETSVICGFIRIVDDLRWQDETYISDEIGLAVWQMTLKGETRIKHLSGSTQAPEDWEMVIKYASSTLADKEEKAEMRKFFGL